MHPDLSGGETLPAAGLPWFMALFGRDSLITSFRPCPTAPAWRRPRCGCSRPARRWTATTSTSESPARSSTSCDSANSPLAASVPTRRYFGTADATPLFLVLLDEYHRWSGDDELVRALEPNARAALSWIEDSGDRDGDGYVEYQCRNLQTGLVNQCWKDSWNSMQFADGSLAKGPIATSEIQGYVYDAQLRSARLAREVWGEEALADQLELRAGALRSSFHRDFWIPERGCYALALDGQQAPGRRPRLERWASALVWASSTGSRPPRWPSTCSARSSSPAGE